jgi:NAD dependent epimerase/dehydratase family enzyme
VTGAEFARTLGTALHRPSLVPVPAIALRLAFGEMAGQTVLASQRLVPEQLTAAGFSFDEPDLFGAVRRELEPRA